MMHHLYLVATTEWFGLMDKIIQSVVCILVSVFEWSSLIRVHEWIVRNETGPLKLLFKDRKLWLMDTEV